MYLFIVVAVVLLRLVLLCFWFCAVFCWSCSVLNGARGSTSSNAAASALLFKGLMALSYVLAYLYSRFRGRGAAERNNRCGSSTGTNEHTRS